MIFAQYTVKGKQKLLQDLWKSYDKQVRAIGRGLTKAGLFIQRESQKIVPVDTGALKNSARTRLVRAATKGSEQYAEVSYNTAYAVRVHEDPVAKHKKGKTYKYLEIPFLENQAKIAEIVIKEATKVK